MTRRSHEVTIGGLKDNLTHLCVTAFQGDRNETLEQLREDVLGFNLIVQELKRTHPEIAKRKADLHIGARIIKATGIEFKNERSGPFDTLMIYSYEPGKPKTILGAIYADGTSFWTAPNLRKERDAYVFNAANSRTINCPHGALDAVSKFTRGFVNDNFGSKLFEDWEAAFKAVEKKTHLEHMEDPVQPTEP